MHRAANSDPPRTGQLRPYRSPTRDANSAAVRRRILEAVTRTVARGVAEVTVPTVARDAGVSVRTVYRHFGSKAGLFDALGTYFGSRADVAKLPQPTGFDELEAAIVLFFRRADALDPDALAVLDSDVGRDARRTTLPFRLAAIRRGLEQAAPGLPEDQIDHLVRVALILTSSFSRRAWKEYLDLSPEAAAAEVTWALRTMVEGARRR